MNQRRVLIVDDDQSIHGSMCSCLDGQGCNVARVRTGREALDALGRDSFDLVITEMDTGEISGLKLLERVKSLKPEMPVVIMTSCCDVAMMRCAFRSGVDDYFLKHEVQDARSRITGLLQQSPTGRGAGPVGSISNALKENILDMLMIMSHDIRGPLVAIAAALKLLKRGAYGSIDQSVENTLTDLYGRVVALIGLAEEFLGKAALVNVSTDLTKKEMDLRQDIIDPVLDELYDDIHRFHIRIDNRLGSIPGNRITVMASKMWLKAVYRNLFRNAIKYGGEACTIAFGFEDHGSYSQFNVYNTGQSIPKESDGKLFTQFGRLENGQDANIDGAGLGLYLIKQIINKHGGDIWYVPETEGSNFVFILPKDDHGVSHCAEVSQDLQQKIA